uniref:TonB C-terminal domain-containing protein n=1 Tax=mine drainage metagenome TaxID=410659 RepID=E6PXG4_9ZZZZ
MHSFQHPCSFRRAAFALLLFPVLVSALLTAQPASAQAVPVPAAVQQKSTPADASESQIEDQLKLRLVGKILYLRGGYLGDNLSFNQRGDSIGNPAKGSFTLSLIEIEKIHFTKRKVELVGARYAMHFLGALPYEDPQKAVDQVRITPRKKIQRITIARELVVKAKKSKDRKKDKKNPTASPSSPAAPAAKPTAPSQAENSRHPGDDHTTSPAHAHLLLDQALDRVFATSFDQTMRASMPEFWQLYFTAQESGKDFQPASVLSRGAVDQQARLLTSIAPDSNDYAQANGIAGRALYRVVIAANGKPEQIAVMRPIGFGLDENAVAAIRKATFQPAMKAGQPVAEALDLAVMFRIYSNRTAAVAAPAPAADKPKPPVLPGPYSAQQP